MIAAIIKWSIHNRFLVLLITLLGSAWGVYSLMAVPLDAIPDLSDVQVIVRTHYSGQTPQVVEDQVTYPLSTAMLSVPGARAVRGYSFFGDSYVYVIFDDETDIYWARSRVLEYLNQITDQLPTQAKPQLGPDASGVGWIYQYALKDTSGKHDLSELRSLQDWFLKYELQTLSGVAEVATLGGMVKQYQILIDPDKLRGYYLTIANVKQAIEQANQEQGGASLELAEAEYMVRFSGYIKNLDDIRLISVPTLRRRMSISSVLLDDIASEIRIGPAARRGVADLDGLGEVVGGIIVMRYGENVLDTIDEVKAKLEMLRASLPEGVELVETYNRSQLIRASVDTLSHRLIEEFLVVVIVCMVFLYHLRSSLVILISLPVGILLAFGLMHWQGINANIMSLGGIAIAIGAMVDATIVLIENVHKKAEAHHFESATLTQRITLITQATAEVGPPIFFSLLIITLSFIPIFALQAQEARLFTPLAYTKTYAMAAAAILSITLVPALMVFFIRGKIHKEEENPLNRWLIAVYKPILKKALMQPRKLSIIMILLALSSLWPMSQLGSEFMPQMNEGDLLYMPTTLPGISIGKARQLLQQTDRLIKTVPEVAQVFGKVGRAETATDPAPLTMIESTITLKPKEQWRDGMTTDGIIKELDQQVQIPGVNNAWLMPIKTRIDMQSTGINTPVGLKIAGPDLKVLQSIGKDVEQLLNSLPESHHVYAERAASARYINIDIDRYAAAHYGLSISDIQNAANIAIAGVDLTYTVEGQQRYPINLRYPQQLRDSLTKLKELALVATEDIHVQLQDLAEISVVDGPPLIKSDNGRLNSWVFITLNDTNIGDYISKAQQLLAKKLALPTGYTITWSGQYQYMQRVQKSLSSIIPFTLLIILILLYLSFHNFSESLLVMLTVPFGLLGGIWFLYALDYHFSVAVAIGFIALAGVAAEFGVVMIIYLRESMQRHQPNTQAELLEAIIEGAIQRVRPKAMTALVIIMGLMPIMIGSGSGSEVMQRIAAPMVGGMVSAPLVSMILIPVIYYLLQRRKLRAMLNSGIAK